MSDDGWVIVVNDYDGLEVGLSRYGDLAAKMLDMGEGNWKVWVYWDWVPLDRLKALIDHVHQLDQLP